MLVYKSLDERGNSTVQRFPWPLPKGKRPGKWLKIKESPVLCQRGFHAWKSLDRAKETGTQVYEVELDGPVVSDHEKVAASRARLVRLIWKFEPRIVERGLRNCLTCGKPHDRREVTQGLAPQWGDPIDGHSYNAEPWENYVARLMPNERVMGYRAARTEARKEYKGPGTYDPVVPAVHGPFRPWTEHPERCGQCGLSEGMHEGWEARKKIADEFQAYDRWELLLVIDQMREGTL